MATTRSVANTSSNPECQETDYISYLEAQLEKSDHERMLVVNQIEGLSKHFGEVTSLRNELADRTHQLSVAQQQLSQEALLVQEEREKVARLMSENAVLSAQTDDDRAKIASLICLRRSEMGVSSGGGAGVHPSLLGGALGSDGYYGNHLYAPPLSAYQERLLEKERRKSGATSPLAGERCIPAGNVPVRVDTYQTSTLSPAATSGGTLPPQVAGGHTGSRQQHRRLDNTMSLRSLVTDYANTHQHLFKTGGPRRHTAGVCEEAIDANTKADFNGGAPRHHKDPTPLQPSQQSPPSAAAAQPKSGFVLATHPHHRGIGGTEAAVSDALQPPLGSQLVSALSNEIETLKILLDEQRRAYESERARRLHEERQRMDQMVAKDRSQVATIARLQDEVQTAVKELVLYRHQQQIVERALRGEIELLKVSCVETQRSVTHVANRKAQDLALALELATTKSQNQMVKLRSEIAEKRAAHFSEKETLLAAVVKLREENDKLTKSLEKERKARLRAERRLITEREGAQSEVGLLKHHLRAIEKKLYFAHAKGLAHESSSAKLLASLVTSQVSQQENERGDPHGHEEEGNAGYSDEDAATDVESEYEAYPTATTNIDNYQNRQTLGKRSTASRRGHPSPVVAEASGSPRGLPRALDETAEGSA